MQLPPNNPPPSPLATRPDPLSLPPRLLHRPLQPLQHLLPLPQMPLQPLHLLPHTLHLLPHGPQPLRPLRRPPSLLQQPQLPPFIIQHLLQLAPHERRLAALPPAAPRALLRRHALHPLELRRQLPQLLLQPHLLPVRRRRRAPRAGEIRPRRPVRRRPAPEPQPAEVRVPELGLPPRGRLLAAAAAASPALRGRVIAPSLLLLKCIVQGVALEAGTQRGGHGAGDAEALVAVGEDVQEGEGGVLVDSWVGAWVDEVPRRAHVRVRHVERGVQRLQRGERQLAARGGVGAVDGVVLRRRARRHVPVEAAFEPGRAAVVVGPGRGGPLEGRLRAGEGARGGDEVGFGGGDEPVGEGAGHGGVFLEKGRGGVSDCSGGSIRGGRRKFQSPFTRYTISRKPPESS